MSVTQPAIPDPLDYSMGMIRLFCTGDIGGRGRASGLTSGWANPEESHCWNEGFDAVLVLATRPPAGVATLSIEGEPYLSQRQPFQDLTVFANGYRAGFWRLAARDDRRLEAVIEPEWWLIRGTKALLKVTFHLPNSTRPSEAEGNSDARLLGFCFRSFSITEPVRRL